MAILKKTIIRTRCFTSSFMIQRQELPAPYRWKFCNKYVPYKPLTECFSFCFMGSCHFWCQAVFAPKVSFSMLSITMSHTAQHCNKVWWFQLSCTCCLCKQSHLKCDLRYIQTHDLACPQTLVTEEEMEERKLQSLRNTMHFLVFEHTIFMFYLPQDCAI